MIDFLHVCWYSVAMLKIRMQRIGRINMPAYRLIVAEHARGPKTGNIVEKVGTYNPKTKERQLDAERIKYWLSVGAQASGTVHNMLISVGIITGKKINVLPRKSPPNPPSGGEGAETEAASAPATAAPVEAIPTEEAPKAEAPKEEAAPQAEDKAAAKTADGGSLNSSQGEEFREETKA